MQVLDDISLEVRRGEFLSLLGPSGCGKTTLLRIIGGFEDPTAGEVRIGGIDAAGLPPYRRRTNTIFQHLALFPHLTVAQNIAFGLQMKRLPRAAIRTRVQQALELVRLPGFGSRRITALSGGQKQRIAMARALVNEPEILLLDEPFGALDLHLRLQMQDELRTLHRATGRTFIFVTHDQGEAISMSDRLAVMQGGRILQLGTPKEVYERPNQRFVAEFMGQSNFLPGLVEATGISDAIGMVRVGANLLPCRLPVGTVAGSRVILAVRYERLVVIPGFANRDPPDRDLEGSVTGEAYMGGDPAPRNPPARRHHFVRRPAGARCRAAGNRLPGAGALVP